MELEERIPLIKIKYISTFTIEEFEKKCITKKTKKSDIQTMFEMLKNFCKTNIKTNGKTKRIYSYSKSNPEFYYEGRLYSGGSIQSISSTIRGFLMKDITTDIDMSNSFANIIYISSIKNLLNNFSHFFKDLKIHIYFKINIQKIFLLKITTST